MRQSRYCQQIMEQQFCSKISIHERGGIGRGERERKRKGGRDLKTAVIDMPSPFTEPSLSKVTELLIKRNEEAKQSAMATRITSNIKHSSGHTTSGLEKNTDKTYHIHNS